MVNQYYVGEQIEFIRPGNWSTMTIGKKYEVLAVDLNNNPIIYNDVGVQIAWDKSNFVRTEVPW